MPFVIPFPEIDPEIFSIGPFALRWYAVAYMAGLILGWVYIARLIRRPGLWGAAPPLQPTLDEKSGVKDSPVDTLLLVMALGVVLGGRLGFVLFYKFDYYLAHPLEALMIWEGGMAFHGGMLGVIIAVLLFARSRGESPLMIGDAVACAAPIGLFFGRIANFINGELWGRVTEQPWGMVFPQVKQMAEEFPWLLTNGENLPRHPSQLYEAALEGLVLFAVLAWLAWRGGALKRPGLCIGVFLVGYGLARGFVEFFRQWNPDLGFDFVLFGLEFTRGQTLCIPMILGGAAFIYLAMRRPAGDAARQT